MLFDIRAEFEVGDAKKVIISGSGLNITYDAINKTLKGCPLEPLEGKIRIQAVVDNSILEIAGNDGRIMFHGPHGHSIAVDEIKITAHGGDARLISFEAHELDSAVQLHPGQEPGGLEHRRDTARVVVSARCARDGVEMRADEHAGTTGGGASPRPNHILILPALKPERLALDGEPEVSQPVRDVFAGSGKPFRGGQTVALSLEGRHMRPEPGGIGAGLEHVHLPKNFL